MTYQVLCEGYHDRAFWKGLLTRFGYQSLGPGAIHPVTGTLLEKGHFGFSAPNGKFVAVVPCHGYRSLLKTFQRRLTSLQPDEHLVVTIDPDTSALDTKTGLRLEDVLRLVVHHHPAAQIVDHRIEIPNPTARASLMRWESPAGTDQPQQQTLERLICAALRQHYPERLSQVDAWLQPEQTTSGKSFAWSYMAKWQPQDGCDRFFEALWLDKPVAETLLQLLEGTHCNSAVLRQLRPEPV